MDGWPCSLGRTGLGLKIPNNREKYRENRKIRAREPLPETRASLTRAPLSKAAQPGGLKHRAARLKGLRASLPMILRGQKVVDIAHGPIYVAAADTHRARIASQAGCQPVYLVGQVGKIRDKADILGHPVAQKGFDVGLGPHCSFLF